MTTTAHRQLTQAYVALFQNPKTTFDELLPFYDKAVVWQEMPNLFAPMGRTNTLEGLANAWQKGRQVVINQQYTVRQILVDAGSAVVELDWCGMLTQSLGALPAGVIMRARMALMMEFCEGKIIRQRNYLCYYRLA